MTPPELSIEILGPLRLSRDGTCVATGPAQQRAVLALLALNAGRVVRLISLVDAVWPHRPPASATNVVQTYVKRLRRLLEPARGPRRPAEVLLTSGDGYLLRIPKEQVDVFRFRAAMVEARRAVEVGRQEAAISCFTRALACWRDVPLSDVPVLAENRIVAELVEEYASALCEYADLAIATGRAGEVLPILRRATNGAPTHERLHARLLACHRFTGQRTTAFEVYRRIQQQLRDDFGVDPSPELRSAYLDLLADESTGPPDLPPVPAQLPPELGEFVGRDQERGTLLGALAAPDPAAGVPVWVLAGMSGMGKTRLAVHVAHRLAPAYRDGQLFGDLDAVPSAELLAQFLVALGVDRSAVPVEPAERTALYRSRLAGRRILVVLDNATSEAQVRPLLPGSTGCAVLVTSRSRLPGLSSAGLLDVGPLSDVEAVALLRAVTGRPVDEQDDDARAVVALCDRMPLAIRIAGVRLGRRFDITLARFAHLLADEEARLDLLTTGDLGVRACFDGTYAALSPLARRVFLSFGLFRVDAVASWTVAVATGMSSTRAELAVDELVDARLVTALGTDPVGEPRYGMRDLVRLYAAERAAVDLTGAERREHVDRVLETWRTLTREPGRGPRHRSLPDPVTKARTKLLAPLVSSLLADPRAWRDVENPGQASNWSTSLSDSVAT